MKHHWETKAMTEAQTAIFARSTAAWKAVYALIEQGSDERGSTSGAYRDSPEYDEWVAATKAVDAAFPRSIA
jgi:hypothetical protein